MGLSKKWVLLELAIKHFSWNHLNTVVKLDSQLLILIRFTTFDLQLQKNSVRKRRKWYHLHDWPNQYHCL